MHLSQKRRAGGGRRELRPLLYLAGMLNDDGILLIGVDHYSENDSSLDWPQKVKTRMTTLSSQEWSSCFEMAGLKIIRVWNAAPREEWPGTLVIAGRR